MSKRWDAIEQLVVQLAGITPGNGYTFDLSVAGTLDAGIETRLQRAEGPVDYHVQVGEGEEAIERPEISPGKLTRATLEIVVDAMIRGSTNDPMRERLNLLLADINRRVHFDESLGGLVQRCWVAKVDPPAYSPEERIAFVSLGLAAVYYYQAGSDI